MLRVEHVNAGYGDVQVLWDVSFHVALGEFVVLVGANGAGKSTIMRTISSMVPVNSGEIRFEDHRVDKTPPHKIVELGIAHVPEGRQLFPEMTVGSGENSLRAQCPVASNRCARSRADSCRNPR